MKAVILVGGEGTRLRPLTSELPKPLLPIANVPFVERTIGRLVEVGVEEVVLSTCYRAEAFERFAAAQSDIEVRIVVEDDPLGTGGAIGFAAAGFDTTFLVLNGDIVTDLDLRKLLAFHAECGAEATIVLTPVDDPSRFGVVPTDEEGRVEAFIEKPPAGTAPTNMINAGTYVCEPALLGRIPAGRAVSVERETFPALVADGALYAYPSDAYWLDFGTFDTYLQANLDVVGGGTLVADDAVVDPTAQLGPGVAVGAGCVIGAGARITRSVVLDGARVGDGAVIDGTIVGFRGEIGAGRELSAGTVVAPDEKI